MNHSIKAKVALLLVCLLIVFAAAEIGLRVLKPSVAVDTTVGSGWDKEGNSPLHLESTSSQRIYELRPNAVVHSPEHETTYTTNSFGFRDREYEISKPDDVFRILVLGDSITFGWKVGLDEIYANQLEDMFAEQGKKVEVISMAVNGYDTLQEAAVLKEQGLAFDPDLVVIGYCHNDTMIANDGGLRTHFTNTPCMLLNAVRRVSQELQNRFSSIPSRGFAQIRALCEEQDIPVFTLIFPILSDQGTGEYSHTSDHVTVTNLATESGFEVIDLYSKFAETGLASLALDSLHPNAEGHRIAAIELFLALSDRVSPSEGE